jgi:AraC family transcriptional regulator of adaptative response/methylated-DNA-[protein]-cysteine methyltransferase
MTSDTQYQNYKLIEQAIRFIRLNLERQPSLGEIARELDVSDSHLQRVFTLWAGVSPKKFLQFLTKERALSCLRTSKNILEASFDSGLSSPSRLHDLMIMTVAMTPGEVKAQGQGVSIEFGYATTPFGLALIGWTHRGICHLMFDESKESALKELKSLWPYATLIHHPEQAREYTQIIFPSVEKSPPALSKQRKTLNVLLKGSNFQLKVWEALIKAPQASVISYSDLALAIDKPKAQRAVGSAVAKNTLAYLIPCHRVIRESGEFGNFRWGLDRKIAMQAWEASQAVIGD